jgi:hypothetical protein
VGFGVLFLALAPFVRRWAHGVNDPASAIVAAAIPAE